MRVRSLLIAAVACFALPSFAQPAIAPGRIPTVTRLVKEFYERESALVANANDAAALDAMLDPAFEMRAGDDPGVPVPRDVWMRAMRGGPRGAPRIDGMAVHGLGDVAIVSFRQTPASGQAKRGARGRFVVDCWKRDGDAWKLAIRYESDVAAGPRVTPRAKGTLEKRY